MAGMRSIGVRLRLLVDRYKQDAKEASEATEKIGKSGQKAKVDLNDLATGMGIVGAALSAFAGAAVFNAAQFEKSMSAAAAATMAGADEIEQLREAALQAGKDTAFSADEAAQGIVELAKAGVSTAEILSGGLRGALDLAAAGQVDVAFAAETAASAMTQFGLSGDQVTHIADLLAAGAGKAQGGVSDMAQALAQAGLVASQTGLTIEETTGALSAFASAGLIGSDAGTSFRTMLMRLAAPAGKAADLMEELGITAFDAQGNFVGIAALAGRLENALGGMSQAQKQATLATIFGADAIRAASILYEQGEQGIQDWIAAVDEQGFAARTAAALTDNLRGDIERLGGEIETLFITSGSGANQGLRALTQQAEKAVATFGQLPAPVQQAGVVIAGLAGMTLLAGAGWIKLKQAIDPALEALANTGSIGAKAADGLRATMRWGTRAALTLSAVAAAGQLIDAVVGKDLNPQIDALMLGLERFAKNAEVSGEAARLFGDDMELLSYDLGTLGSGAMVKFGNAVASVTELLVGDLGMEKSLGRARERIAAIDTALAQMVQSGHADTAALVFAELEKRAHEAGISTDDLRAGLSQYSGAVEVASGATEKLANDTSHLVRQQIAAVEEGELLIDLWNEMNGVTKSADEQMLDAVEAVEAVGKAFKENSGKLKGNSKAALENRIAIESAAEQAFEAADAFIIQGGSALEAAQMIEDFKEKSIEAAIANGGNADEVKRLADEMFRLPEGKTVKVIAQTEGALAAVRAVENAMERIKNKNIKVNAQVRWTSTGLHVPGGTILRAKGGITEHAQAGLLREPEVFAPVAPAQFAFAEPSTGGEAFVPKNGDRSRALSILQHAANWHDADVVPRGAMFGSGGGGKIELVISAAPGSDRRVMSSIVEGLRVEVRSAGGDVQTVLGQR